MFTMLFKIFISIDNLLIWAKFRPKTFLEKWFFKLGVLRNDAKRKFWNRKIFFFLPDKSGLVTSINGAIFMQIFYLENSFRGGT